jgi:hypothetical protein
MMPLDVWGSPAQQDDIRWRTLGPGDGIYVSGFFLDLRLGYSGIFFVNKRAKIMRRMYRISVALALLAGLGACATLGTAPVVPGQSEAEVIARLGQPTHIYADGASRLLEYMHGPMGQATEMARIGPDGKLVTYEQVLTMRSFAKITVGAADKNTVLRTIGAPSETRYYAASRLEEWSYPFKDNGVWDSLMAVYFDQTGIVRKLQNGPDPRYQLGAFD